VKARRLIIIYIYIDEVSSNYVHLLKSYALGKEMLHTDGCGEGTA